MAEVIRMPRLSDTMEEGNIVAWLVKEGDQVSPGDVLAEVETDKATMELESFFSGTMLYIGVKEGNVPVDGIIAIIGDKSEDVKKILEEAEAEGGGSAKEEESEEPTKEEKTESKTAQEPAKTTEHTSEPKTEATESKDSRLKASPLAKSMAADAGIDISLVTGSGENGRIIKKDIENYIANPPAQKTTVASGSSVAPISNEESEIPYGDMPVTQMRKVIAKRLGESKFTAPHFYLTMEVNMDNAVASRKAINDAGDVRISFNDMIVKACASALRKHRMINSSWHGDKITVHEDINIGVAVAVPDGLLVPVVKHADRKSLTYIGQEVREMAKKAKAKKLQPAEMSGNTFTISNLGMFDIDEFTAIINPPDACIMAVGSIQQKPIVKDGQIVVGNIMKVTLSCDHRVVDGVTGAQYLTTFKQMLENPLRMLV